jgi:type VI protein secretion system component VasA
LREIGCTHETLRRGVRRAVTKASAPAQPPMSANGSRRSSARTLNCAAPMRSCARHRRFSPRRSSTAEEVMIAFIDAHRENPPAAKNLRAVQLCARSHQA